MISSLRRCVSFRQQDSFTPPPLVAICRVAKQLTTRGRGSRKKLPKDIPWNPSIDTFRECADRCAYYTDNLSVRCGNDDDGGVPKTLTPKLISKQQQRKDKNNLQQQTCDRIGGYHIDKRNIVGDVLMTPTTTTKCQVKAPPGFTESNSRYPNRNIYYTMLTPIMIKLQGGWSVGPPRRRP